MRNMDTVFVLILAMVKCTGYADIAWWIVFLPWLVRLGLFFMCKIILVMWE